MGKGKDDVAITCEVMLDQTGLVLFGTGGVTDGLTEDVRDGWAR